MSQAVSSLSAGSTDAEALKNSINSLTCGLGMAFDTTLLGLVLSMIMSFPMAAMQKQEEEVLTLIDAFCNEKLLPRLERCPQRHDGQPAGAGREPAGLRGFAGQGPRGFPRALAGGDGQLKETGDVLKARLDAHQKMVEGTFTKAVEKLSADTKATFQKPAEELNRYFHTLSTGIESLNTGLKKLGEEKVVIQKRGFFSR